MTTEKTAFVTTLTINGYTYEIDTESTTLEEVDKAITEWSDFYYAEYAVLDQEGFPTNTELLGHTFEVAIKRYTIGEDKLTPIWEGTLYEYERTIITA